MTTQEKKDQIRNLLIEEVFIERRDEFRNAIQSINSALHAFKVDYTYDYDTFCKDFMNECFNVIDKYPDVDLTDSSEMFRYTQTIILNIVMKISERGKNTTKENDQSF